MRFVFALVVNTQVLQALSVLVGLVIPILTALVTKSTASSSIKALVNALLSAVSGSLVVVLGSHEIVWYQFVLSIGTTWLSSIATYYGLLKPTGAATKVAAVAPNTGLG